MAGNSVIVTSTDPNVDSNFPKVTGTTTSTSKHGLDVFVLDGTVGTGGMLDGIVYDFVGVTYPTSTQEVYVFKTGGSGGTTVATITLNYTTSSKTELQDATRT